MATDVEVQYFSHLNGLVLSNNWGDLIRLLDKALVTGIDFTQITAASIDAQGDVSITLFAAHNAMLFQVVELSGFTPNSLNQKYRIKGVPSTTQLISKPENAIVVTPISVVGNGKLASLGYDIIFRDANDVKRVYRAKNPTAQHPFIRVDETLSDGMNTYPSTYSKCAMVGLLERMDHIDDYEHADVLQLPFDPGNPVKNWEISGTGASVIRGWCKWFWAGSNNGINESSAPQNGFRNFSLAGDRDAFFIAPAHTLRQNSKHIYGCGLYNSSQPIDVIPNWFLCSSVKPTNASTFLALVDKYAVPFNYNNSASAFLTTKYNPTAPLGFSCDSFPVMPDYQSGQSGVFSSSEFPALEIPFYDADKYLRGSMKHLCYLGVRISYSVSSEPSLSKHSMFIKDSCRYAGLDTSNNNGFAFYLGELE